MTIRNKIFITYIFSTLLIGVVAIVSGYYYSSNSVRNQILTDLKVSSDTRSDYIETYIFQIEGRVEGFASDGKIIDCLTDISSTSSSGCSEEELNSHLIEYKLPVLEETLHLSIMNVDGVVVASTIESDIDNDYSDENIFTQGIKDTFLQAPAYSLLHDGVISMLISTPIQEKGEVIGVILAEVNTDRLYEIVTDNDFLSEDTIVYMTDQNSTLTSPVLVEGKEILSTKIDNESTKDCIADLYDYQNYKDISVSHEGDILEFAGINEAPSIGIHHIIPELNSCLYAEMSASTYLSRIDEVLKIYLLVAVAGMGFLLIATVFILRGVGEPLKNLQEGAEKLQKGELSYRIETTSNDELGELANAFNKMANNLEKKTVELESSVADRTQELQKAKEKLEAQRSALINLLDDVTTEKNIEEQQSRQMFETIGEGIVLSDANGKVTYINPAFEKLTGYSSSELVDKDFAEAFEAYDLNDQPLSPEMLSNTAAVTAKNQETKVQLKARDGHKVAVTINATPVYVDNDFKGVVRVVHDFSEDLELARQKDDFFSIASHDLRTPLTVISGNLDIVLEGYGKSKITEDDKQLLQDTMKASDRLIKLVNDFLNVSRLDQGRLKTDIQLIDSCAITESVINELKTLTDEKDLKLTYTCTKDHNLIMADENLLKEILFNIIGNSIKFTEKGSIKVEHTKEGENVITRITDTGPGIDPDKQDLLFQRFQRATDRTMDRKVGGTGLGLYISREFARVMGGDLVLEKSVLGEGSTFKIIFPQATQEQIKSVEFKNKENIATQKDIKNLKKENDEKDE